MSASTENSTRKSKGRPRKPYVAQHLTMPVPLSEAIDAWIAAQPDPKPSRPEAVRRLVEQALGASGTK